MKGQRVLSFKFKFFLVVRIFLMLHRLAWEMPLLMRHHPQFRFEEFIGGGEKDMKL